MSIATGEGAFPPTMGAAVAGTSNLSRRHARNRIATALFLLSTLTAVLFLVVLLATIILDGGAWLSWGLLTDLPSRFPDRAGLSPALWGSLWLISLTAIFAFIVGLGAAIYLEEYAPRNRWTRLLETNISNLAGVPSVVYGLLGLALFVEVANFGRSILSGALTLGLLILPVIIIAGRESLRAVPLSLRQGAYALGATPWQVTRHHVLPAAMPGILTGAILAISRAIGETAPILVAGAAGQVLFRPDSPLSQYTALPIQIYQWTARPQAEFRELAAAAIIVLLVVLLAMNGLAIYLRQRFSRALRW
ncbi:MAG: phosphate ABC transporter permease PstA [Thermomicrobiales bacterium]